VRETRRSSGHGCHWCDSRTLWDHHESTATASHPDAPTNISLRVDFGFGQNRAEPQRLGEEVVDAVVRGPAAVLFLDADTLIPRSMLSRILQPMEEPTCLGRAVKVDYQPARPLIRLYVRR
jgi:hypothetical protein